MDLSKYAVRRGFTKLAQDIHQSFSRPSGSSTPELTGITTAELTSALIGAASNGHVGTTSYLPGLGADLSATQQIPAIGTPLIMSFQAGRCDVIELFIQRGANLREKVYKNDPLRKAWEYRRPDSIHCLVKCGIIIGQYLTDPSMQKLLDLAVNRGHCGLANVSLRTGLDPNIRDTTKFGC